MFIEDAAKTAFTLENTDCDGSLTSVISNEYCHVTFTTLVDTYGFNGGEEVWAKVTASNLYGESALSVAGNTAVYTRVADPPTLLTEDET